MYTGQYDGTVELVIAHNVKRIVVLEPFSDSVDFPRPDDAVDVPRNENVNIWIEHNQIAVHFGIQSCEKSRIDGHRCVTNAFDHKRHTAQVNILKSTIHVTELIVSFSLGSSSIANVVINTNNPTRIVHICRK